MKKWIVINEYFDRKVPEQIIKEDEGNGKILDIITVVGGAKDIVTGAISDVYELVELIDL